MWRTNEPMEEDVSDLSGIDPHSKWRRSRRRAWRDGLADQTVAKTLEDARCYRAFERALVGSVDPRSVIELALVHRLASLLWRLRRASAIETGLFEIRGEVPLARPQDPSHRLSQTGTLPTRTLANGHKTVLGSNGRDDPLASSQEPLSTTSTRPPPGPWPNSRAIAQCFLRLSNHDPTLLGRVGRYEARLWRQTAQALWMLDSMRRPPPTPGRRSLRKPFMPFDGDSEHSRMG
jgi:hypothetical protein